MFNVIFVYREYDCVSICQHKLALALNNDKADETLGYIINGNDSDYMELIDVHIVELQICKQINSANVCESFCEQRYYQNDLLDERHCIELNILPEIKDEINHCSKNKNIDIQLKYETKKIIINKNNEDYHIQFKNETTIKNMHATKIYNEIKIENAIITKTTIKSKQLIEIHEMSKNNKLRHISIIKDKLLKRKIMQC